MVYLSEGGRGWAGGEVVLPSPGSEPPPPYSPPRVPPHQRFFPPAFPALLPHHHYFQPFADYYDLTPAPSQPGSLSSHDAAPPIKDPPPPYPPMPSLKAAHAALNHGPSSAFSPPTKTIKYTYPPPYTPTDTAGGQGKVGVPAPQDERREGQRSAGGGRATEPRHRERRSRPHAYDKTRSLDHRDPRNRAAALAQHRAASGFRRTEASARVPGDTTHGGHGRVPPLVAPGGGTGHPRGPLLRTGKSLELPHERTSHPPPATAHTHPAHAAHPTHPRLPLLTKDGAQGTPPRTKEPSGAPCPSGTNATSKSARNAHVGVGPAKPARSRHLAHTSPPAQARARPTSRSEERWAARTSRLEAAAAQAMQAARAVPVNFVHSPPGAPAHAPAEAEGHMSRGRLRSCRSLDELSDLLDEEAPRPPVATRSLDDLTEPLYENVDVIHAHARAHHHRAAHNTSVPDLLEAPPRPPRQRNNSLSSLLDDLGSCGSASLARRALNTSVPDVLEAGFSWGSPTSTLRSAASSAAASAPRHAHDATSDISVQLQKIREVARVLDVKYRRGELSSSSASSSGPPSAHTSPRMPSSEHTPPHHHAPGVPARAPVIHDVLRDNQKLQQQQPPSAAGTSLPSLEADATSQESGYSSVDSRSFRQHQRSPPDAAASPPQHSSQQKQQQHQQLRSQEQPKSSGQQQTRVLQQDSRAISQQGNGSHRGQNNQSNYHDINELNRKHQMQQQQRPENAAYRQQEQHQQKLSPRQQQPYQHRTHPSQHQQQSKHQHQQMQQLRPQQKSSQQYNPQRTFLHRQQQQQEEESHSLPYQHQHVQQLHIQQVCIASCGRRRTSDAKLESFIFGAVSAAESGGRNVLFLRKHFCLARGRSLGWVGG